MSRDIVLIVLGRPNRAALLNKRTVIDHLIREIKMNAVLLHDAQRSALFPETLVGPRRQGALRSGLGRQAMEARAARRLSGLVNDE